MAEPAGDDAPRLPFYTIGHSTRTLAAFTALLRVAGVTWVADIRTVPRSRANPQFNADALPTSLAAADIGYSHIAALGGLRGKTAGIAPVTNGYWQNGSFHRYADYTLTPAFADGLAQLLALGRRQPTAMMCAEAVWWRCHRRIVTDHLLARGEAVFHLMDDDRIEPATLTPGAVVGVNGAVTYPAPPAAQPLLPGIAP